ncbi:hypothetical protein KKI24_05900 [bacterium]|nr:hypothetical protein [bacterium]
MKAAEYSSVGLLKIHLYDDIGIHSALTGIPTTVSGSGISLTRAGFKGAG